MRNENIIDMTDPHWLTLMWSNQWGSPVQFGSLHQSVGVSIADERPAVQTCEAFRVIFLFPCNLRGRRQQCLNRTVKCYKNSEKISFQFGPSRFKLLAGRTLTANVFHQATWEAVMSGQRSRAQPGRWASHGEIEFAAARCPQPLPQLELRALRRARELWAQNKKQSLQWDDEGHV